MGNGRLGATTTALILVNMVACATGPAKPAKVATAPTTSQPATSPPSTPRPAFAIYVIDVGQGDATLIVGPKQQNGHRASLLMDAGDGGYFGKPRGDVLVRAVLDKLNIKSLDYVVMSHFDSDHLGGLVGGNTKRSLIWTVTKTSGNYSGCKATALFPKRALIDMGPPVKHVSKALRREWEACAPALTRTHNIKHIRVVGKEQIGRKLKLGKGVTAQIVAGRGWVLGATAQDPQANSPNEQSIALLIKNKQGFSFLVTGDLIGQEYPANGIENAELEKALAKGLGATEAKCYGLDVLRTGHHGAANATEKTFIERMCPTVAIISAGDGNGHGHPYCKTLNTLHGAKVPVILQTETGTTDYSKCASNPRVKRTIADGTIHITVKGKRYWIESFGTVSVGGKPTKKFRCVCNQKGCGSSC